ncbi:hypothetical protein [Thermogemmatispora sp.]|nr:hypothetical protein [Thermogemmatispora sp.]
MCIVYLAGWLARLILAYYGAGAGTVASPEAGMIGRLGRVVM